MEMINKQFGQLTVIKEAPSYVYINKRGKQSFRKKFLCLCNCGHEFIAIGSKLRRGKTIRWAYCSYKLRPQSINRYTSEERLYKLHVVGRCKKANIENQLTLEQFSLLINQSCTYCGANPRIVNHLLSNKHAKRQPIKANGIDRKDSKMGYTIENCVSCCWDCNRMKGTLTVEEFYDKIFKIIEFKGFYKETK